MYEMGTMWSARRHEKELEGRHAPESPPIGNQTRDLSSMGVLNTLRMIAGLRTVEKLEC